MICQERRPQTIGENVSTLNRRPVDNGVPDVCGPSDNRRSTTARSPGDGGNRPRAMTESPQQGDPMSQIVPPPPANDHPHCPACGSPTSRWSERLEDDVVTAWAVCDNQHLYSVRWAVVS